jgi:hypothetical protein
MSAEETPVITRSAGWVTGLVLGLAGLFYAYAVWNAVAHLISMAQGGLSGVGWITLSFGIVFPYGLGRRRGVGELALALLAGLGIVAVFWLSLLAFSLTLVAA